MPGRKSDYPSGDELRLYLEAAGFTVSDALAGTLQTAADAGRDAFERAANRKMLGDRADVARPFDPPANRDSLLSIDDLCSFTSLRLEPYGGTVETLERDRDFWLEPVEAEARREPWTRVRFRRRWMQPLGDAWRRSVRITGRWGYGLGIPDDAYEAMIAAGLLGRQAILAQSLTGGLVSFTEGNTREDYGSRPLDHWRAQWESLYTAAVARYRRLEI